MCWIFMQHFFNNGNEQLLGSAKNYQNAFMRACIFFCVILDGLTQFSSARAPCAYRLALIYSALRANWIAAKLHHLTFHYPFCLNNLLPLKLQPFLHYNGRLQPSHRLQNVSTSPKNSKTINKTNRSLSKFLLQPVVSKQQSSKNLNKFSKSNASTPRQPRDVGFVFHSQNSYHRVVYQNKW